MASGAPSRAGAWRGRPRGPRSRRGSPSGRRGRALDARRVRRARARRVAAAPRAAAPAQRGAALAGEVLVEPRERRAPRDRRRRRGDEPERRASSASTLRPESSSSSAAALADALRQQAARRGREDAELDLGLAELRVGRREDQRAGKRQLEAAAQALPAHGHQDRHRATRAWRRSERVQALRASPRSGPAKCSSTQAPKLKFGPSASIRRREQVAALEMRRRAPAPSARDHRRVDDVGLGPREAQPEQRPASLEPDAERRWRAAVIGVSEPSADEAFDELLAPGRRPSASAWRSATKSTSRSVLRALVEGAEAGARLGHHVEREPGARVLLVAVPGLELGLAQLLEASW